MNIKYTAEETLQYVIKNLLTYLEELKEVEDSESEQFMYGEKIAYIECLEMIKFWESADNSGLNIDIEFLFLQQN